MSQENYISLYDYLGKAAGTDLGRKVNECAQKQNQPYQIREISNPKYKGRVILYKKSFLDEYFKKTS
jgi:hypothetical protein